MCAWILNAWSNTNFATTCRGITGCNVPLPRLAVRAWQESLPTFSRAPSKQTFARWWSISELAFQRLATHKQTSTQRVVLIYRSIDTIKNAFYRCQFEIGQDIIKVVKLGELKVNHLVLELENATHRSVEHMPQDATLLRVDNLVVALLQTSEDLDVLDVHRSQQLKGSQPILKPHLQSIFYELNKKNDVVQPFPASVAVWAVPVAANHG